MNKIEKEMTEAELIQSYHPNEKIKFYLVYPQADLRFVNRNGEKVLQQLMEVRITFEKEYWRTWYQGFTDKGSDKIWMDVPTVEEKK